MTPPNDAHPIHRLFAALTEHTFMTELGMTDVQLIDYLTSLLTRFVHRDAVFAIRGASGRRLEEIAAMMVEAEQPANQGERRREIYRHMGDFALFWTGVYPEALRTRSHAEKRDALINYYEHGKRSYYLASTYSDTPTQAEEAPVLRRLSVEFEMCAYGLRKVRAGWESLPMQA